MPKGFLRPVGRQLGERLSRLGGVRSRGCAVVARRRGSDSDLIVGYMAKRSNAADASRLVDTVCTKGKKGLQAAQLDMRVLDVYAGFDLRGYAPGQTTLIR